MIRMAYNGLKFPLTSNKAKDIMVNVPALKTKSGDLLSENANDALTKIINESNAQSDEIAKQGTEIAQRLKMSDVISYFLLGNLNVYENMNLDIFTNAGVNNVKNCTNQPSSASPNGKLIVLKPTENTDYITQIFFPPYQYPFVRYGYYSSGWKWSSWLRIGTSV